MTLTDRTRLVKSISDPKKEWDIIIVGGGATGLGTALDAAARGYQTLLLEQSDFAKGTSSRSTKLVHGGVRYLAQGDIGLVRQALRERGLLWKNAPHLVRNISFLIPIYHWWEAFMYLIGLRIYDLLAGKLSFGKTRRISKKEMLASHAAINPNGLYGGVVYHDGQFDDSRLAINLAQSGLEQGATLLNYFRVTRLNKNEQHRLTGLSVIDLETAKEYQLRARAVINATGVFADELLQMDQPENKPLIRPSQGAHLVIERSFMPTEDALMIPKTDDGRVLFIVPWHNKLILGTTDTPLKTYSLEPRALQQEINFILDTAGKYLVRAPHRKDVLSVFAGLRPLAAPHSESSKTKEISRSHKLFASASGLITITGGKWTTYRKMGEDAVDMAIRIGRLPPARCTTTDLAIHGSQPVTPPGDDHLYFYGSDRPGVLALARQNPLWAEKLHPGYAFLQAQVIWALRHEMARTVEDVLARRIRLLFLDAQAALEAAPMTAALMAEELQKDIPWQQKQLAAFQKVAANYLLQP